MLPEPSCLLDRLIVYCAHVYFEKTLAGPIHPINLAALFRNWKCRTLSVPSAASDRLQAGVSVRKNCI